MMLRNTFVPLAVGAFLLVALEAEAADTWEGWEPGPTNTELYAGYSGIGLAAKERGAGMEFLQGFGLGHTLSTFISATIESAGAASAGFAAGFFGTPLDTDHVDLDLILVLGQEWRRLEDFSAGAAFELNLDLEPDLSLWGGYLRGCVHVTGARDVIIETILGTYLTLAERHQILLEADATFVIATGAGGDAVDIGGIALGYNVLLHDAVELVTQLFFDLPQSGESFSVGLMAGLIWTFPATGEGIHM